MIRMKKFFLRFFNKRCTLIYQDLGLQRFFYFPRWFLQNKKFDHKISFKMSIALAKLSADMENAITRPSMDWRCGYKTLCE